MIEAVPKDHLEQHQNHPQILDDHRSDPDLLSQKSDFQNIRPNSASPFPAPPIPAQQDFQEEESHDHIHQNFVQEDPNLIEPDHHFQDQPILILLKLY